jgi:tetratricopeptide (TPR) repeat protein
MWHSTKYIFVSIIIICIIVTSIIYNIGKNSNIESKNDFESYVKAVEFINSDKSDQATFPLEILEKKYPDNPFILRTLGEAYASTEDNELGLSYFKSSLDLAPTFQLNANFMFEYGQILYLNGEYYKAEFVLKRALTLKDSGPFKKTIKNLLTEAIAKGE